MPGVVYITAEAPWGPVLIGTATSMGDMLRQVITPPAHVEDCGTLDAGLMAEAARQALGVADARGSIKATVAKAISRLAEAHRAVLATTVAAASPEPAPASRVSHGEAAGIAMQPVAATERVSPARPFTDVKAIRDELGMSQGRFARSFGVSLATVQDWEQGRSRPNQTARAFLRVIATRPDVVRETLNQLGAGFTLQNHAAADGTQPPTFKGMSCMPKEQAR